MYPLSTCRGWKSLLPPWLLFNPPLIILMIAYSTTVMYRQLCTGFIQYFKNHHHQTFPLPLHLPTTTAPSLHHHSFTPSFIHHHSTCTGFLKSDTCYTLPPPSTTPAHHHPPPPHLLCSTTDHHKVTSSRNHCTFPARQQHQGRKHESVTKRGDNVEFGVHKTSIWLIDRFIDRHKRYTGYRKAVIVSFFL